MLTFAIQNHAMYIHNAPLWLRILYPRGLEWRIKTKEKKIFLTFDDGPIPEITPKVVSILAKEEIEATFFCVGENIAKHPDTYRLLIENGHQTGNHAYHHNKAYQTDYKQYLSEVESCNRLTHSNLFRPPHGQLTHKLARTLRKQYRIILWTVLTGDFDASLSPEECLAIAIKHTKPGAIVVFHDSLKASERLLWVLPRYISYCKEQGYTFGNI